MRYSQVSFGTQPRRKLKHYSGIPCLCDLSSQDMDTVSDRHWGTFAPPVLGVTNLFPLRPHRGQEAWALVPGW